ncbi:MAG: ATP-binding protein [Vicinamibacterales bacterium]
MPTLTAAGYALVGITVLMSVVLAALLVSLVRLSRRSQARSGGGSESAMLSSVLQESLVRLKAQERATAARAEASERLASQIITGVGAGLIVVDGQGMVQIVNPAARRILNLDGGGEGKPVAELLADAAPLAAVIGETIDSGVPVTRRQLTMPGRPSHLGVSVSPLSAPDGGMQAAVCLFTDLSEVVALEEQLRLKEALAGVGELTAGLAHEFRNGLATIHGYARLFDPEKLPEPYGAYVEAIREETTAMGEVVTNFLNFARPQHLSLVDLDLHAIVERAAADQAVGEGALEIGGAFGRIMGDEVLLRQALSNLMRNGVEACTTTGRSPWVRVEGAVDGGQVVITIDDGGPGIPADSLSRIFKPFVTTKAQGTGLGLAIVQKVIVSHNGRIAAENRPEGGARFRIHLPLAADEQ